MSIDYSQDYEAPVVTASVTPLDEGEISLRPKTLRDYTGQERQRRTLRSTSRPPGGAMSRWITFCSTALRAWVRRPWPG